MVIQLRVVNVIKAWIKDLSDFNDKLLTALKLFVDGTLRLDNQGLAAFIMGALNKVFLCYSISLIFANIPHSDQKTKRKQLKKAGSLVWIPQSPRYQKTFFLFT